MAKEQTKWTGYTEADLDCVLCQYYGGISEGEIRCLMQECVCKEELREALRRERIDNGNQNQ